MDVLAPGRPGRWSHDGVTVVREGGWSVTRTGGGLTLRHGLDAGDLDERLVARVAGVVRSRRELELVLTGLVRSTVDDPLAGWLTYYRQSLAALEDGRAAFAPVHARAAELVVGRSVLDLGSCFGFFPLRLTGLDVTATDSCPGTMRLLARVSRALGVPRNTLVCDAAAVPRPDGWVDTVTVLHLLEHLTPEHGARVVAEARRLARRRVVIAVPLEDEPDVRFGHVRSFTPGTLAALAPDSHEDGERLDCCNSRKCAVVPSVGQPASTHIIVNNVDRSVKFVALYVEYFAELTDEDIPTYQASWVVRFN